MADPTKRTLANFASMKNLVHMLVRRRSIGRKKSEKIGKIKQKNAAAYVAERLLFLESFFKLKIRGF